MSFTRSGDPSTGGLPTLAGSSATNVYGSLSLCSGMTFSYTSTLTFKATSGTKTITSNGVNWNCDVTFNGSGGTFQFVDNFSWLGSSKNLTLTNGTVDFATNSITTTLSDNSTISGAFTFYNLTHTGTANKDRYLKISSNITVSNNLSISGGNAAQRFLVYSDTTGTARTITCGGTVSINAVDFRDITLNSTSARTIASCADNGSGNVRFATTAAHGLVAGQQVYIAGTTDHNGSWAVSAVSDTTHFEIADAYVSSQTGTWVYDFSAVSDYSGDCQGNSGMRFTESDTMYFKQADGTHAWDDGPSSHWFLASNGGGGTGRVPLPQDDVVFDYYSFGAGSMSINANMPRLGRNITFAGDGAGAIRNTPNLLQSIDNEIYGSLTLVSGMTRSGNYHFDFRGRSSCTLTTAGISLYHILVNAPGGTLTLGDDLTCTANGTNINYGTFDANDHNFTFAQFTSSAGTIVYMGGGIWEITEATTSYAFNAGGGDGTLYPEGSTLRLNISGTGTAGLALYSKTYNNIEIKGRGSYTAVFWGSNTFNNIHIDASQAAKQVNFTNSTTQTVNSITRDKGNKPITFTNSSSTTRATLAKSGRRTDDLHDMVLSNLSGTPAGQFVLYNSKDNGNNIGFWFAVDPAWCRLDDIYLLQSGSVIVYIAGTIAAKAAITGSLPVARALTGVVSSKASLPASSSVARGLSGQIAASSAIGGASQVARGLAGIISSKASFVGSSSVARALVGEISAKASVTVPLSAIKALAGVISAKASVVGSLDIYRLIELAGIISAKASVVATSSVLRGLQGVISARSSLAASMSRLVALVGTISAKARVLASATMLYASVKKYHILQVSAQKRSTLTCYLKKFKVFRL